MEQNNRIVDQEQNVLNKIALSDYTDQEDKQSTSSKEQIIQEPIPNEFLEFGTGIKVPLENKVNDRYSVSKNERLVFIDNQQDFASNGNSESVVEVQEVDIIMIDNAQECWPDGDPRMEMVLPGDSTPPHQRTNSDNSISLMEKAIDKLSQEEPIIDIKQQQIEAYEAALNKEKEELNALLESEAELFQNIEANQSITQIDHNTSKEAEIHEEQKPSGEGALQAKNCGKPLYYYVYGGNYPETVSLALQGRGNWQECKESESIEKCHFLWRPFNYPVEYYKRIDKRIATKQSPFIYNHFEILKGLVTKTGLIRSLKQYYFNNDQARQNNYSIFDSTPTTFLLISGQFDSEWSEFTQRYKDIQRGYAPKEKIPIKHCVNNIWLVKPANANQGRGIEIFSDLDEITWFINTRPPMTCCVVQKYIERPLLFKGRKFDIRVWALFTCKNEVFMYKYGYLRTSSDDYNLSNGNNYVHLTNNCLQKYGNNYGVHEDGNTVGFHVFQQYLDENFPQYGLNVERDFIPRMKDLIIDTFNATKLQLNPNRRKNCFELLGYDFLIDEDFRLWLIEVNTNPYFGVPNVYIADLLPKMMDDLLDIVLDPTYPPTEKKEKTRPNNFELIYKENSHTMVNQRRQFNTSLYPIPELAQQVGPKAPKQDLKYLKQFKVANLSLSTWSFKKAKENGEIPIHKGNKCNQPLNDIKSKRGKNESKKQVTSVERRQREKSTEKQRSKSVMINRNKEAVSTLSPGKSNNEESKEMLTISHDIIVQSVDKKSLQISRQENEKSGIKQEGLSFSNSRSKTSNKREASSQIQVNNYIHSGVYNQHSPLKISIGENLTAINPLRNASQTSTPSKGQNIPNKRVSNNDYQNHMGSSLSKTELNTISYGQNSQQQNSLRHKAQSSNRLNKRGDQFSQSDLFSNNSASQEQLIQKRFRQVSKDKQTSLEGAFTIIFAQLIEKTNQERQDNSLSLQNLETLATFIEMNKSEFLKNESNLIQLLNMAINDIQTPLLSLSILSLIEPFSERLHFKQAFSRSTSLQLKLVNFYRTINDFRVKKLLIKLLTSLSCLNEPSRIKALKGSPSKYSKRENSIERRSRSTIQLKCRSEQRDQSLNQQDNLATSIIRDTIYKKSLKNGLVLFILKEQFHDDLMQKIIIQQLTSEEQSILIQQLRMIENFNITDKNQIGDKKESEIKVDVYENEVNTLDQSQNDSGPSVLSLILSTFDLRLANKIEKQLLNNDLPQSTLTQSEAQLETLQSQTQIQSISAKNYGPRNSNIKQSYSMVKKKNEHINLALSPPPHDPAENFQQQQIKPNEKCPQKLKDTPLINKKMKSPFTTAIKIISKHQTPAAGKSVTGTKQKKKQTAKQQQSAKPLEIQPFNDGLKNEQPQEQPQAETQISNLDKKQPQTTKKAICDNNQETPEINQPSIKERIRQIEEAISKEANKNSKFKPVLKAKSSITTTANFGHFQRRPSHVQSGDHSSKNTGKLKKMQRQNQSLSRIVSAVNDGSPQYGAQKQLKASVFNRKGSHYAMSNLSGGFTFGGYGDSYYDNNSRMNAQMMNRGNKGLKSQIILNDQRNGGQSMGNLEKVVIGNIDQRILDIQKNLNVLILNNLSPKNSQAKTTFKNGSGHGLLFQPFNKQNAQRQQETSIEGVPQKEDQAKIQLASESNIYHYKGSSRQNVYIDEYDKEDSIHKEKLTSILKYEPENEDDLKISQIKGISITVDDNRANNSGVNSRRQLEDKLRSRERNNGHISLIAKKQYQHQRDVPPLPIRRSDILVNQDLF